MKVVLDFIKKNYKVLLFTLFLVVFNYFSFDLLLKNETAEFVIENKNIILLIFTVIEILLFIVINILLKKEIPEHKLFLTLVIPIGIIYMLLIPIGRVPDEKNHFLRAYEISEGHLISDKSENGIGGQKLSNDVGEIFSVKENYMKYDDLFNNIKIKKSSDKSFFEFANMSLYSFVCYIPQVVGVLIGKIFNLPTLAIAYLGRITNYIVWVMLMYYAIKLIPFKKTLLLAIAFMPMMMQEAISLSADALTNGVAIFLISYVLYLKNSKIKKIGIKESIILSLSCILMSLCKIVYLPICLILFLLPSKLFKSNKDKIIKIVSLAVIVVALNLFWLSISFSFLVEFMPNVNSPEQVKYLLTHPVGYIKVIFNSINSNVTLYLFNIIGFSLCYFDVNLSMVYVLMYLVLIAVLMVVDSDKRIGFNEKILTFIIVMATLALICTSLYVQWTALAAEIIDGIQGRYFIPLLLPLALLVNVKDLNLKDCKNKLNYVVCNLIIFISIYSCMVIYFYHI